MKTDSWKTRAINQIKRENDEEGATISKICAHLKIPDLSKLFRHDISECNLSEIQEFVRRVNEKRGQSDDFRERILELQRELEQKQRRYSDLKARIGAYVENAQDFENQLARNEKEKAEILNMFQQGSKRSDTFTLSELEEKQMLKQELQQEHRQAMRACVTVKKELQVTKDLTQSLYSQLENVESMIKQEQQSLREEAKRNEQKIHELKNEIRKAKQKIQSLTDDNMMLKQALGDDE